MDSVCCHFGKNKKMRQAGILFMYTNKQIKMSAIEQKIMLIVL